MKKRACLLVFVLISAVLLSVTITTLAEELTAFIPNKVARLQLPDYSNAVFNEYSYDGDPFLTGQEGGKTTVYWEEVTVRGHKYVYELNERTQKIEKVKNNAKYDTLYIPRVVTNYPVGNYIRKIVANYRNDKARTLVDYLITYQVSETEKYTIRYAAANATIKELHEYESAAAVGVKRATKITFSKWDGKTDTFNDAKPKENEKIFVHQYYQDQILEGWYDADYEMTLKSGSGKNFKKWYLWEYWTGKVVESHKRGLKPVTAFKSPRVQ